MGIIENLINIVSSNLSLRRCLYAEKMQSILAQGGKNNGNLV